MSSQFERRKAAARAARGIPARGSTTPSPDGAPPRNNRPRSRAWERLTQQILARDAWLCFACRAMGCPGTGADGLDHTPVPYSECEARNVNPMDPRNLRAIHTKQPCQFCGVKCNSTKAAGSMEAFRIKWEKKTGRKAAPLSEPVAPAEEGRDWP